MQTAIGERQKRDYERYEAHRFFEEQTDIAERLSYPIDLTIPYEMRGGAAYALTDTKHRPFHDQTAEALERGRWTYNTPSQEFQIQRLSHEHDEALMVDAFGRGELPGNVIVKLSKVPDKIVSGETDIDGYRRDILRSFVRIYYREADNVHCRLFTLDHNHRIGMQRVGALVGIDAMQPSEDVLASPSIIDVPPEELEEFVAGLADTIKKRYDESIWETTGKMTHAGSEFTDKFEAMSVINSQDGLMRKHMQAISGIMALGLNKGAENDLLEVERKRTAAAIKLASQGVEVHSNGDASVTAAVETGNFDRECPTGPGAPNNGMNQAQMNFEEGEKKWMNCPFCGFKTFGDPCAAVLSCDKCSAMVANGTVISEGIGRNGVLAKMKAEREAALESYASKKSNEAPVEEVVKRKFGAHAVLKVEVEIGGAAKNVYDKRTNELITKL